MEKPQGFSKFSEFCQLGPVLAVLSGLGSLLLFFQDPNGLGQLWLLTVFLGVLAGFLLSSGVSVETRDFTDRFARTILLSFFFLGLILRLTHLDFGMPYFNHPDEGPKARIVQRMIESGTWNPHYFLHPSLLLYLAKLLQPFVSQISAEGDVLHQSLFAGRLASALAGSFSIPLLYVIARTIVGGRVALTAAAILATAPLHVTCSRYMKEDVLCLFFVLAAMCAALRATKSDRLFPYLLPGLLSGFAAGSKYTGILSFVVVGGTFFLAKRYSPKYYLLAGLAVPLGFLCCCPYAALDSESFLRHFMVEQQHMEGGHHGIAISASSQWWMYHWSRSILPSEGPVLAILALLGAGMLLRSPFALASIGLWAFLLFYLPAEWVKAKPPPQPERYILSCLPFIAILAAYVLEQLRRRHNLFAQLLCFVALVCPAAWSVLLASELKTDTRQLMRDWMIETLPANSKILIEASYSPRLEDTGFDRKLIKASKHPADFGRTNISRSGYEYLLVNSFSYERYFSEPEYNEVLRRRFENIFKSFSLVQEFRPRWGTYGFNNPIVRLYKIPDTLEAYDSNP